MSSPGNNNPAAPLKRDPPTDDLIEMGNSSIGNSRIGPWWASIKPEPKHLAPVDSALLISHWIDQSFSGRHAINNDGHDDLCVTMPIVYDR